MKKSLIILIINIIILITTILFWFDSYRHESLIRNIEISNMESVCYETLLLTNYMLGELAKERNLTIDQIEDIFVIKDQSLLRLVNINDFEWKSLNENKINIKEESSFDTLLLIEPISAFLLFKDGTLVDYRISCQLDTLKFKIFLQKSDNILIDD